MSVSKQVDQNRVNQSINTSNNVYSCFQRVAKNYTVSAENNDRTSTNYQVLIELLQRKNLFNDETFNDSYEDFTIPSKRYKGDNKSTQIDPNNSNTKHSEIKNIKNGKNNDLQLCLDDNNAQTSIKRTDGIEIIQNYPDNNKNITENIPSTTIEDRNGEVIKSKNYLGDFGALNDDGTEIAKQFRKKELSQKKTLNEKDILVEPLDGMIKTKIIEKIIANDDGSLAFRPENAFDSLPLITSDSIDSFSIDDDEVLFETEIFIEPSSSTSRINTEEKEKTLSSQVGNVTENVTCTELSKLSTSSNNIDKTSSATPTQVLPIYHSPAVNPEQLLPSTSDVNIIPPKLRTYGRCKPSHSALHIAPVAKPRVAKNIKPLSAIPKKKSNDLQKKLPPPQPILSKLGIPETNAIDIKWDLPGYNETTHAKILYYQLSAYFPNSPKSSLKDLGRIPSYILPMACRITDNISDDKVCIALNAVDEFYRCGPCGTLEYENN